MKTQKFSFHRPKNRFSRIALYLAVLAPCAYLGLKYANPAPPRHLVIATGADEGDYDAYARTYAERLAKDGIRLETRASSGALENLQRLRDPKSGVDVAFVQDGLAAADEESDLVSLGSVYYEPMWVFYRGNTEVTRFAQLRGKRLAVGDTGGGTKVLSTRLLKTAGVDEKDAQFVAVGYKQAAEALHRGEVDAAFFIATPDDAVIHALAADPALHLMNVDHAEAIARNLPYLHHLVLPHGALDLHANLPAQDTHLVSPTATLLARDTLHPALIYVLLKAATEVHSDPGIFQAEHEFPADKDVDFPLSDEANRFFKSGGRFWHRHLPYWLANLVERFILVVLPLTAVILPLLKMIPQYLTRRVTARIHQRYGELKYLETQMRAETDEAKYGQHLRELDGIEDRVNRMKVPLDFTQHVYSLREHIEFVRAKLNRGGATNPATRKEATR